MKSTNFEFLRHSWNELAELGAFAEQYMTSDPRSCHITCRILAEEITKLICRQNNIITNEKNFIDLLQELKEFDILPIITLSLLHRVRKMGNTAAHDLQFTNNAPEIVKSTFLVARWWYNYNGGATEFVPEEFNEQVQSIATKEQLDENLEKLALKNKALEEINQKLINKNNELHHIKKEKELEIEALTSSFQREIEALEQEIKKRSDSDTALLNRQKADVLIAKEAEIESLKFALEEQQSIALASEQTHLEVQRYKDEKLELERKEHALILEIQRLKTFLLEQKEKPTSKQVESPLATTKKSLFIRKQKSLLDFHVEESNMDEDQLDLIDKTLDKSMLVSGCAGSGKSVIAYNKALQIHKKGGDVILIVYTKSLNKYMFQGVADNVSGMKFYYHWQWKNVGMPMADYIIVDEIQDFSQLEIQEFISATRKNYFFFGDTAQSIYNFMGKKTLSIDEISKITDLEPLYLYNNYRLPRSVAQITQPYVAVDANQYSEKIYKSTEKQLPHFFPVESIEKQSDSILRIFTKLKSPNMGILVPNNELILRFMELFNERNFICEFKYAGKNDATNKDTLNFNSKHPKLMTYHSAKGLQFETVILPMFAGAKTDESRKALYVAMTRTYRHLYLMYATETLEHPLNIVPAHLYLSKES